MGAMYNNPQIFKANTVMQLLNKMKKQGGEEQTYDVDAPQKRLARDGVSNCDFANKVITVY